MSSRHFIPPHLFPLPQGERVGWGYLVLPVNLQQPPSIRIALILTRPSAIFLRAEFTMREKVGREILIRFAASSCFISSRSASLRASNSSSVRYTPCSSLSGLQRGRKHLSPGAHLIHLIFLGLMKPPDYEQMFITNLAQPPFICQGGWCYCRCRVVEKYYSGSKMEGT